MTVTRILRSLTMIVLLPLFAGCSSSMENKRSVVYIPDPFPLLLVNATNTKSMDVSPCSSKDCRYLRNDDITNFNLELVGKTYTAEAMTNIYARTSSVAGVQYCIPTEGLKKETFWHGELDKTNFFKFGKFIGYVGDNMQPNNRLCPYNSMQLSASKFGELKDPSEFKFFYDYVLKKERASLNRELSVQPVSQTKIDE